MNSAKQLILDDLCREMESMAAKLRETIDIFEPKGLWSTGDIIKIHPYGSFYMVSSVDGPEPDRVALISLTDGDRWAGPIDVKSAWGITGAEMRMLIGNKEFIKVPREEVFK